VADGVVRILSIDGGGIRGIIPALVINRLLGKTTAACGLAKPNPMTPEDILGLYVKDGGSIFKKRDLGFVDAKYDQHALLGYLGAEFDTTHLSDVNGSLNKAELLVPSYAIGLPRRKSSAPMFFRSWQARGEMLPAQASAAQYDFKLSGVACATSAAPTFFPPAILYNRLNQRFVMIDGGMFANNPTMAAIVEARRLYGSTN
jgi:uncharacterized protein